MCKHLQVLEKTELLTQRYLALLPHVNHGPEEIIAITFTRKATAEMRRRIMAALKSANEDEPDEPHKKITWQLAKKAMQRDAQQQWNLLKNPNRLRVFTLDSLARYICQQLPIAAESIANFDVTERAETLFEGAINQFFNYCITDTTLQKNLQTLLLHLDNRPAYLRKLLIQLLYKREQWLPHIIANTHDTQLIKQQLEKVLHNIHNEAINQLNEYLPHDMQQKIVGYLVQAAETLQHEQQSHTLCNLLNNRELTTNLAKQHELWQIIIPCLTTKDGKWRKTVDKRLGFAKGSELKQQYCTLLTELSNNTPLLNHLNYLMTCPPSALQQNQWHLLKTLFSLLPILAACCQLVFQEKKCIDFTEMNIRALNALGSANNPSDIALKLDYKINHLLIDEFQDTSINQFRFIELLIAGWQPGDMRSLFLVGDPMQSIYRFREADVSLFLRAKNHGMADIKLTSLTLTQNFRSEQPIIKWINHFFSQLFPINSDANTGAIHYNTAHSNKLNTGGDVNLHPLCNNNAEQQATYIINLIQNYQAKNSRANIAILVRSRRHLYHIMQQCQYHDINVEAIDIKPLNNCVEIIDLFTLTSALLHRHDNVAWMALLRSPYCGLLLKDIYYIVNHNSAWSIWKNLIKFQDIHELSDDARARLPFIVNTLHHIFAIRGSMPTHRLVQLAWQQLNVASNYSEEQIQNCSVFFDCLMSMQTNNEPIVAEAIHERLATLFHKPSKQQSISVKLLTIHKSKGLEFDHVILPELNRKTQADSPELLLWSERINTDGRAEFLMAPIKHSAEKSEPIYQYIAAAHKQKNLHETQRLFYVAATRAIKSLDLVFSINYNENAKQQFSPPSKSSFAGMLWSQLKDDITHSAKHTTFDDGNIDDKIDSTFIRYKTSSFKQANPNNRILFENKNAAIDIEYANETTIGTITHQIFDYLATLSAQAQNSLNLDALLTTYHNQLYHTDIDVNKIPFAIETIALCVKNILSDPRGRWIFSQRPQTVLQ